MRARTRASRLGSVASEANSIVMPNSIRLLAVRFDGHGGANRTHYLCFIGKRARILGPQPCTAVLLRNYQRRVTSCLFLIIYLFFVILDDAVRQVCEMFFFANCSDTI